MDYFAGNTLERVFVDKGYRGHNAPPDYKFRVFITGQRRRTTLSATCADDPPSSRSSVISRPSTAWAEVIFGAARGDAINAVLAAAGYNFSLLLRWLRILLCPILAAIFAPAQSVPA
jgi:transposase, IS5 family